ncbi:MAG: hypothetical protein JO240_09125 [Solirubrobacterales bacterium]|nr:hypothetical protein [Solirubrobacterales bacterium]
MTDLGDLLELLHGAAASFHTVEATCRIWRDESSARAIYAAVEKGQDSSAMAASREVKLLESEEHLRIWQAGNQVRVQYLGGRRKGSYGVVSESYGGTGIASSAPERTRATRQ